MQRALRARSSARVGLVAAAAAALGGCAADGGDAGITVMRSVAPSSTCTFSASDAELTVGRGALDVALRTSYLVGIQMTSRITALDGQDVQRAVFVSGAKVDITFPDSTLFTTDELTELKASGLTHFKTLFSTVVKPNGGITDAAFELIPFELGDRLRSKPAFTQVVALGTFRIIGRLGVTGSELESDPFQFPVTLTNGGLANSLGACSNLPTTFMPRFSNACNPAQDGIVDCCTAPDNTLVCPAVGTKI
jgi:hypothetical protein